MKKMANKNLKILLVDDEETFLKSIAQRLRLLGFEPLTASGGREALVIAESNRIDMAIVDLTMPDMDGLVTITKLKEIYPGLRSVLLTGHGSEKVKQATEALKADYFEKDHMEDFWDFIRRSHRSGNTIVIRPPSAIPTAEGSGRQNLYNPGAIEIVSERETLAGAPPSAVTDGDSIETSSAGRLRMIGETRAMQKLRRDIERVAALDCTVIIRGESGTGKALAARTIHNASSRKNSRFVAVNCGSFSNDLLIEELVGRSNVTPPGGFRSGGSSAGSESGGTVLLDQIEDMPARMQLSMLKIMDSRKIHLQEGVHDFPLNVRILAASGHDLAELVEAGKFNDELYYRLNVLELFIPPLRERRDDIAPLCGYFIRKFSKEFEKRVDSISDEVIAAFMSYEFPGNVRELEHIIERGVILAEGDTIEFKHLPGRFHSVDLEPLDPARKFMTLAELEKKYILEVLEATGGNKTKTTELLGISRAALWRKLKQFKEDEP